MQSRDWQWLRQVKDVVNNREERLPEVGRYNAGQKLLFFVLVVCMLGLLLSGLVIWREFFSLYFSIGVDSAGVARARRVRIHPDLRDHRAHLCCDLGEGLDAGDDAGRRDSGLGLETSSGLVPGDDPCNEFSNPARLRRSRSDPFRGFACRIATHLFAPRAARLRQLSEVGAIGHAIGEYLHLMAALADAQQAALVSFQATPPDSAQIARAREFGMPLASRDELAAR